MAEGKTVVVLEGVKLGRTAVRVPAGVVYAVLASLAVGKPAAVIVVVLHGSYQSTPNWGQPSLVWSDLIDPLWPLHQPKMECS